MENVGLNKDFWRGRRVFLTGHTGFKGTWMTIVLHQLGAKVTGFALAPDAQMKMFDSVKAAKCLQRNVFGDITDLTLVRREITQTKPDVVIHMAAQSLVHQSYKSPVETYSTNVMGTVNLLEAVRSLTGPCAVVNVTSDKCYENVENGIAYKENDAMGGHDPYSNSKGCAELVTSAFRNSYFREGNIQIASARAGNVIGGGDYSSNRLFPDIVRSVMSEKPITLRSPKAVRPWQHVLEPVLGYLLLAEKLSRSSHVFDGGWNFGPSDDDVKSVAWITDEVLKNLGSSLKPLIEPHEYHEATMLRLNSNKAHRLLDWKPRWNVSTAVARSAEWYSAERDGSNLYEFTLRQIDEFLEE